MLCFSYHILANLLKYVVFHPALGCLYPQIEWVKTLPQLENKYLNEMYVFWVSLRCASHASECCFYGKSTLSCNYVLLICLLMIWVIWNISFSCDWVGKTSNHAIGSFQFRPSGFMSEGESCREDLFSLQFRLKVCKIGYKEIIKFWPLLTSSLWMRKRDSE